MLFILSKAVQLVGLGTVGFGLVVGLRSEHGMMQELQLLLAGSVIFIAGWLLQKRGET